jgi:16S rRNA (uracil1498-N3)-methyltransferase
MQDYPRLVVAPEQILDDVVQLTNQQKHYLGRVLRLQPGDYFCVLNGVGLVWLAQLTPDCQGRLRELLKTNNELPRRITLLLAIPKNGFEEVIHQTTELGVAEIIPVISDRTIPRPSEQKLQRWRAIAQEATEQSERQVVPVIRSPQKFAASLTLLPSCQKYICLTRVDAPPLIKVLGVTGDVAIAIGPEGGFSEPEIALAQAAQFQSVSLGNRILRAVTAPTVVMAIASSFS